MKVSQGSLYPSFLEIWGEETQERFVFAIHECGDNYKNCKNFILFYNGYFYMC